MEERLGAVTVSAWFDDAEVVELNDNNLILYSPYDFRRDTIMNRYARYVHEALKEKFNSDAFSKMKKALFITIGALRADISGNV